MISTILKIGGLIGTLGSIFGVMIACYKTIRKIDAKFENIDKSLKENQLSNLRLVIVNKDMPLDERVSAGEKYVKLGGNGSVHAMVDVLTEEYKKELGGK